MAFQSKMRGTEVTESDASQAPDATPGPRSSEGRRLAVSELVADRAAAPSPFGDDQTFPLPVSELTYTPTTTP